MATDINTLLDNLTAAFDACRPYAHPGLADQLDDAITTCRQRLLEKPMPGPIALDQVPLDALRAELAHRPETRLTDQHGLAGFLAGYTQLNRTKCYALANALITAGLVAVKDPEHQVPVTALRAELARRSTGPKAAASRWPVLARHIDLLTIAEDLDSTGDEVDQAVANEIRGALAGAVVTWAQDDQVDQAARQHGAGGAVLYGDHDRP